MKQLRKLYTYVVPYWKQMALAAISLTIWSLISLAMPYSARYLVDSVFVSYSHKELNRITLILIGLFLFQAVVGYSQNYLLHFLGQRVIADLRLSIQQHLLYLPLRFFKESRVGENRVPRDQRCHHAAGRPDGNTHRDAASGGDHYRRDRTHGDYELETLLDDLCHRPSPDHPGHRFRSKG